jgi:hypothetical protein
VATTEIPAAIRLYEELFAALRVDIARARRLGLAGTAERLSDALTFAEQEEPVFTEPEGEVEFLIGPISEQPLP